MNKIATPATTITLGTATDTHNLANRIAELRTAGLSRMQATIQAHDETAAAQSTAWRAQDTER